MKKLFSILSVAALAANLQAGTITVKGSDTLVVLAQKWAEVYMGEHKDTKIQVSGGGTGTGFAALQNQTTDLCDASRKAKAAEIANCIKVFNGKRPTEYKVALDGLSVYVNPENPVKELTLDQVKGTCDAVRGGAPTIVSVFAGRLADTGQDPMPLMRASRDVCVATGPGVELLWASTREVFNIVQAEEAGCHIITAPADIIRKMSGFGKTALEMSLDTVKTFKADSDAAGFKL